MVKNIRIGTCGWSYKDWKNKFYPPGLCAKNWFKFYSQYFDTVEINNTFYQLPSKSVFKNWHAQAKKGFIYAVKVSRYITHMKKLKDCQKPLKAFFKHAEVLGNNLGPFLYQLPPGWNINFERLNNFLKILPKAYCHIFEFRNNTWFRNDVFGLLDKYGASFCIHDMRGLNCPKIITGKAIYLRFHGTVGKYDGGYADAQLGSWARWLKQQRKAKTYIYFNNDVHAHAVYDAQNLKEILRF